MILLIRIADTIDAFDEDARLLASLFALPLAEKHGSPMVSFPAADLEPYLRSLIGSGHRVAVCQEVVSGQLAAKEPA